MLLITSSMLALKIPRMQWLINELLDYGIYRAFLHYVNGCLSHKKSSNIFRFEQKEIF